MKRRLKQGGLMTAMAAFLVLLASAASAQQVEGVVINETTGQPAPRVALTLIKFDQGMSPIDEVYSGANGAFSFSKSLTGTGESPVPGMVRAEFEGVSYSKMIRPGTPTSDVRVPVYGVSEEEPAPLSHIMIFEPGGSEMVVNETFLYNNNSQPPMTFRNAERGTLRFYLPPEARDFVRVSVAGPAGMPLESTAVETEEENVRMVDFPVKPGENRVSLTYLVPHQDGETFEVRVLYPDLRTRIAAPSGVTIEGEGLTPMGQEPQTQASVYETGAVQNLALVISGQGSLGGTAPPSGAAATTGGGESLRVAPAPIHEELSWIIGLTAAILGVGFYSLLSGRSQPQPAPAHDGSSSRSGSPSSSARRREGGAVKPRRKR